MPISAEFKSTKIEWRVGYGPNNPHQLLRSVTRRVSEIEVEMTSWERSSLQARCTRNVITGEYAKY